MDHFNVPFYTVLVVSLSKYFMRFKYYFKSDIMFTSFNTLSSFKAKCQVHCISLISEILILAKFLTLYEYYFNNSSLMKAKNYFVRISMIVNIICLTLVAYWRLCDGGNFPLNQNSCLCSTWLISESYMQPRTLLFNAVLYGVFSMHIPSQSLLVSWLPDAKL